VTFQFVRLGGDHKVSPVMGLQPLFEFQVLIHPTSTRVENHEAQLQRASPQQVLFDELFPLELYFLGHASVPISGQVDKVELTAHPVEIDQLRTTGPRARKRQPLRTREAIQQTRLAHVAPAEKRNFGQRLGWKLIRPGSTRYKFGLHPTLQPSPARHRNQPIPVELV
jgi:hypothetical protein